LKRLILTFVVLCALGFACLSEAETRNSVSFAAGIAKPEAIDTTFYITGAFRWQFNEVWALEPDIGYWEQENAQDLCLARGCATYGLSDIHVGANLLLTGSWNSIGLYSGGGAAAHFRKSEITRQVTPPEPLPDRDATRLGLQILFGADFPINDSFEITGAIRNDFVFRDDEGGIDLGVQSVFKAYAGLRFYLD